MARALPNSRINPRKIDDDTAYNKGQNRADRLDYHAAPPAPQSNEVGDVVSVDPADPSEGNNA